jgi:hypothetical protein
MHIPAHNCAYMHTPAQACTLTLHTHAHTSVHTHTCAHMDTFTFVQTHAHIHTQAHPCLHPCTHMPSHVHTPTHVHACMCPSTHTSLRREGLYLFSEFRLNAIFFTNIMFPHTVTQSHTCHHWDVAAWLTFQRLENDAAVVGRSRLQRGL